MPGHSRSSTIGDSSHAFAVQQILAATAALATAVAIFSLRRQHQMERKCDELKRLLSNNSRSNQSVSDKRCKSGHEVVHGLLSESESTKMKSKTAARDANTKTTQESSKNTLASQTSMDSGLNVRPIGYIQSIYRLCVGTPRQGLLAPNARGCIDLLKLGDSSTASSVSGLEEYSHIWIIFVFHLNTISKKTSRIKSKIAPPALGGQKVGIFATRTPHRFNPVGITLCKLDRIQIEGQKVKLHISGLDLVDGTPVLDIKPYVPVYDSVQQQRLEDDNLSLVNGDSKTNLRVPSWVAGGLSLKRTVLINDMARAELQSILESNPSCLEFYGPHHGETVSNTLENALECIRQVLAIDVRSSYQTKKSRSGKFQAERSSRIAAATSDSSSLTSTASPSTGQLQERWCTQQLDNLLIYYEVKEASTLQRSPSENSGAEDVLIVVSIRLLEVKTSCI